MHEKSDFNLKKKKWKNKSFSRWKHTKNERKEKLSREPGVNLMKISFDNSPFFCSRSFERHRARHLRMPLHAEMWLLSFNCKRVTICPHGSLCAGVSRCHFFFVRLHNLWTLDFFVVVGASHYAIFHASIRHGWIFQCTCTSRKKVLYHWR